MGDLRVGIVCGVVATLLSCGGSAPEDPIIVEIGRSSISYSQFESYVDGTVEDQASFAQGEVKAQLLQQFIEETLLLLAADEEGIEADPKEVEALVRKVNSLPEPTDVGPLDGGDGNGAGIRIDLAGHLRVRRLIENKVLSHVTVDDGEIADHFEANRVYYRRPEVVDVSQILVDTEEEASRIHRELASNPKRFEELAVEFSQGPEAARGGHLGSFRRGELPPDFEEVVFSLRKGRMSDVVKTDFGFHIFRLNDIQGASDLSLEEVADAIRVELLQKKSEEALSLYIGELEKRYTVKVHTERLDFPYMDRKAGAGENPSQGGQ